MNLRIHLPLIDEERLIGSTPESELSDINIPASMSAYDTALFDLVVSAFPDAIIETSGRDFHVWDEDGNADTDETRNAVDLISYEAERLYDVGEFWVLYSS